MNIPWDLIIEAIFKMLENCNVDSSRVLSASQNPTLADRIIIRQGAIDALENWDEMGSRREARRYWRQHADEIERGCCERAASMTKEHVELLMSRAKSSSR